MSCGCSPNSSLLPIGPTGPSGSFSGTLNRIAKFTPSGTQIGDSQWFDDGTNTGYGTTSMTHYLDIVKAQDTVTTVSLTNSDVNTSASARYYLYNGTSSTLLQHFGSGFTTSNANFQNGGLLQSSGAGGLSLVTSNASGDFRIYVGSSSTITARFLASTGNFGLGISPTAVLHLKAGTATASTAPLKFTSGTSLTISEAGSVEFTTDDLFFTIATGTARKRFLFADPVGGLTSGRVSFATTNGRLLDTAKFTWDNTNNGLLIDATTGAGVDTLRVISGGVYNTSVFTYSGTSTNISALYARNTSTSPINVARIGREVAGDNTYGSMLNVYNQAGTTIGVGAGAGIDFGASTSTLTVPPAYAQMGMVTTNITNATYAGYLFWKVATGAALTDVAAMYSNGLYLGGIAAPNTTLDINGGLSIRDTTKTQITSNQDNYAIGSGTSFRMSSDASRNVTGITGGVDGKILIIKNIGAQNIVFTHQDAASTAANRILASTGANITLAANGCLTLQYDATTARWRDIALR